MLNLNIEETRLKDVLKEALIEILKERRDLIISMLEEIIKETQSSTLKNNDN